MHGVFGNTFGKFIFGLKTVDVSGNKISIPKAFYREIYPFLYNFLFAISDSFNHFISLIALVLFVSEIISISCTKKNQAIHDIIAKTIVVREELEAN